MMYTESFPEGWPQHPVTLADGRVVWLNDPLPRLLPEFTPILADRTTLARLFKDGPPEWGNLDGIWHQVLK